MCNFSAYSPLDEPNKMNNSDNWIRDGPKPILPHKLHKHEKLKSGSVNRTQGQMGSCAVVELQRNAPKWSKVIDEIVRMEKKIFPKHESLARSFDEELKKRNSGLLYSDVDGDVAGYVMYSWPSSLCASITKLAGSDPPTPFVFLILLPVSVRICIRWMWYCSTWMGDFIIIII